MAKRLLVTFNCDLCGKEFQRKISSTNHKPTKRTYCSRECRYSDKNSYVSEWTEERRKEYSDKSKGENNPNFGNRWNDEQRAIASELKKSQYENDPNYRYKVGKSNRGVKFSQERINNMHAHRTKESYQGPRHTEESKKILGEKSSAKFEDEEFIVRWRKTMEDRGHWIKIEDKTDWQIYCQESNWVKPMWDIIDLGKKLLLEFGVFNAKKNSKGVVRDHRYSRKSGLENKVFPEILRHPCNCEILTHSDNVKKKSKQYRDADNLTLQELFSTIKSYNKEWEEQELVLKLIGDYENGIRWQRR